jgi:hypothetical protein
VAVDPARADVVAQGGGDPRHRRVVVGQWTLVSVAVVSSRSCSPRISPSASAARFRRRLISCQVFGRMSDPPDHAETESAGAKS